MISEHNLRVLVSHVVAATILWTLKEDRGEIGHLDNEEVGWVRDYLSKEGVPVQRKRKAFVPNASLEKVEAYLPSNYSAYMYVSGDQRGILIEGYDDHGWTLHEYVIPRLASGLIVAKEITP